MERVQDSGHIRALDGIRGLAVSLVFVYHVMQPASALPSFLKNVVGMGWIGVDLFFVLSGFLITTILLDARNARNYFKVFYMRRLLRIFPLYYLVLIAALVIEPEHYGWKVEMFYWLNLSNLPTAFMGSSSIVAIGHLLHFWSLAIEEQFYAVWPALVYRLKVRTIVYVCLTVIAGSFIVRNLSIVLRLNQQWPEFVYRLTPFRLDTLCSGALLAVVVRYRPYLIEVRRYLWIALLLSGGVFLFVGYGVPPRTDSIVRFGYTSLAMFFTSLVALSLDREGWIAKFFANAFLRKLGKYSYCFYLLHPFILSLGKRQEGHLRTAVHLITAKPLSTYGVMVLAASVEFVLLMGLCALSWNFFEAPILRSKRHFRYDPRPEHYLA